MNGYIAHLLTYLPIIPAAILCCAPMRNSYRFSRIRTYSHITLILILACMVTAWIDYATGIKTTPLSLMLFIFCFAVYHAHLQVHISKSLAVFCMVLALMSVISSLVTAADAAFNPEAGAETITVLYIVLSLLFSIVAALILFIPFSRYGSMLIETLDIPRVWFSLVPILVVITLVNMVMIPDDYRTLYEPGNFRTYVIVIAALLGCLVSATVSFYHITLGVLNSEKQRAAISILQMQEDQFEQQQRYMEETAGLRHDFRQTMYTLNGLLQAGDYSGLKEYFESYFRMLPDNPVRKFCINQPLNALLNYYAGVAQNELIDLRWKIDPLEDLSISDVDLCTVVGNILENAVAACSDTDPEHRFIQLSVVEESGNTLFVVASNSCRKDLEKRGGTYVSSKNGGGMGLGSVTRIAQSHGGSADFSDSDGIFYSNIMIPLNRDTPLP